MGNVDSQEISAWQAQYQIPPARVEQVLEGFQNTSVLNLCVTPNGDN